MRAAVLNTSPGDLEIEEIKIEAPGPDEVLVQTVACGLCHSDLHFLEGKLSSALPRVLGHEAAGIVQAVGSDVTEFRPGDRVVSCLSVFCGSCGECAEGRTWLCQRRNQLGRGPGATPRIHRSGQIVHQMGEMGGFAEQMLVHRNAIVNVPDDLPLELGALLGCAVITGVGSVINGAKVPPGATVAVIGAGGVGLNIIQGAALAGAERIIAIDLRDEKLALATVFGATDVINGGSADPVQAVLEMTGGGVDYAFEAIGLSATALQAFEMIRPGRTAYLVGLPGTADTIQLPGTRMLLQARGLQGLFMGSNRFKRDIPMLANLYLQGRLKLDELVSERITLDSVNDGFAVMKTGVAARSVVVF
jgi:S-(hydroxymethyl)glutathione dehydrogenase/alcohol dehydrogenase